MSDPSFLGDNIDILVADLLAGDGSNIDIRYSISDLNIKENIFTQCMSGSVSVMDGMALIDKLPIVGEEFFTIKFRTPESGNIYITKTFAVYNVSNRVKVDEKLEHYKLNLISLEGIINTMTNVNQNYIGLRYDEIAEKVFQDYISGSQLKGGPEKIVYMDIPKTKKSISTDKSAGLKSMTTVGDTPFKIIQKCADLAQSEDYPDADFVFYEDRDQFNFYPISFLLEQDPTPFGEYLLGDHGIDEGNLKKDDKFRFNIVNQFEYNTGPNSLENSSNGMYGNQIHAFDPILKKRNTIINNYLNIQKDKKIPSFKTLDGNNLASEQSVYSNDSGSSHSHYYINNIFEKNYEEIDYMKDRIKEENDRYLFHHDDSYKSRGRTAMKFGLLNNYTLTIAVGGNSNLKVGQVVNLNIPLSSSLEDDKIQPHSHLFGNGRSNKFLIISLNHNFIATEGRFFTYLTLAKDSYFNDINKNYAGKLKRNA
jgi:hypothetical protein|tara:strand:+ start:2100 stop:3539 length:1440 start_codon:yes stop_codon:yes gene_type:complete